MVQKPPNEAPKGGVLITVSVPSWKKGPMTSIESVFRVYSRGDRVCFSPIFVKSIIFLC